MEVTDLDGRAFAKFVVAGTYFLRKYRGVLDDLNVFPVPDGDTGSNMYLTARAALAETAKVRGSSLATVAEAAARGSLLGARGNSGVIFSQLLRGFARTVARRATVDVSDLALGLREAVGTARAALVKPVEGTIISVASAAAAAANDASRHDRDVVGLANEVVRAAAEALDRTPEQLPVLKEAGVVDSGGAGLVYFLEGILRFLPGGASHATAFPRSAARPRAFNAQQSVGANRFCTELVLEDAALDAFALRELLAPLGDSLLVVGTPPTLKVHVHTSDPAAVRAVAAEHGQPTRDKVDDMERQHRLLVVESPAVSFSTVAVVPGQGFARIARELGADAAIVVLDANPSVRDLVLATNACLAERVYLFPNDPNVALAAREAARLADRQVIVVPTADVPSGFAAQLALAGATSLPSADELSVFARRVRVARVFTAGKDASLGGVMLMRGAAAAVIDDRLIAADSIGAAVEAAARELGAEAGGLLSLYSGGVQQEDDVRQITARLAAAFEALEVESYVGGQRASEYVVSLER